MARTGAATSKSNKRSPPFDRSAESPSQRRRLESESLPTATAKSSSAKTRDKGSSSIAPAPASTSLSAPLSASVAPPTPVAAPEGTALSSPSLSSSSSSIVAQIAPDTGDGEVGDDADPTEALGAEDEEERYQHWDNFVEEYHDTVIELPLEFQRTFTLVKELEDSQQAATQAFKQQLLNYLHSITSSSQRIGSPRKGGTSSSASSSRPPMSDEASKAMLSQVTKAARATIRAAEDKINLAQTLYDSVDRHIQRLDSDLARHEDSLVIGMRPGTLPSHDAPSVSQKEAPGATTSRGAIALGEKEAYEGVGFTDDEERHRRGRGGADGRPMVGTEKYMQEERRRMREEKLRLREEKQRNDATMGHIDPNEPTYCFCERVSFGQMVGCENDDCAREWFHFECVGLEAPPVGEWFCSECAKKLGKTGPKKKGR